MTTTPAPVVEKSWSTSSKKSVDSNGNETDTSHSYVNGANGTHTTSNTTQTAPDGSAMSSTQEERTASPNGDTSTTRRTSTTTTQ